MSSEIESTESCVGCGYDLKGLSPDAVCPECGASISRSVPACPRCAREGRVQALRRRPAGGAPGATWRCAACHGLGFERNELKRAAAALVPPVQRGEQVFDLTRSLSVACTRCSAPMQSIVIDTRTLIDRCGACGLIWVDSGELPALAAYVRGQLGNARPPRDFEELLGDPGALRLAAQRSETRSESVQDAAWWVLVLLMLFGG